MVLRLRYVLYTFLFVSSFSVFGDQNSLDESISSSLRNFTKSHTKNLKLSCAPSRGPASTNKTYMLSYKVGSTTQTLVIESEQRKIKSVALLGDFVEFSRWKTFIPEEGKFRIDAQGKNQSISELVLNSNKPDFMKALEQLAPKAVDCCSDSSCRNQLQ